MITAIVIPVDLVEPLRLEQLDVHDYNTYRRLVDGYFTIVGLNRPRASLYVNEDGQLLQMRENARATALLWVHRSEFRGHPAIVGQAFIVGPPDDEDNATSVPQDLIDLLFTTTRYRVQVQTQGNSKWYGNEQVFTDWFTAYHYGVLLAQRWTLIKDVRVVPELDDELLETWYQLGRDTPEIAAATDPPFTKNSFTGCYSVEELAERISKTAWPIGTTFYYRDLCFIQWVTGGDEWFAIRHGIVLESFELIPRITDGTFASLVHRLLTASKEQCERREY